MPVMRREAELNRLKSRAIAKDVAMGVKRESLAYRCEECGRVYSHAARDGRGAACHCGCGFIGPLGWKR